ncbi:HTH domain-containing protein [Bradyrhizobium oligotrophicum]|uniref:HTH domain-containing protein n=1 Tax=Bradyrhizobium oligotrophicum TaxID=44255 RepID=UPI003EBCBE56
MSDANNEQLLPPPSWDKFEEMCADLFSRIWNDTQLVRYGRTGQRQNGVDIYGKENGADSGVQCKGKRNWPPTKLTIAEIDTEVEEAKKFNPALKTYIFATTADNDVYATDHVNAISAKHAEQGLFRVTAFGWRELVRRFYDYPELLEKHFNIYTLRQLQRTMPTSDDVAVRVVEELKKTNLVVNPGAEAPGRQSNILDDRLAEAIDRDFASRYERALQRSVFPELNKTDELAQLATEILDAKGITLSSNLRRAILLRASRSAAVRSNLPDAARFLAAGQSLSGSDPDAAARARLAVAEGRVGEGIQILRDLADPDSRSVLFSILAKERSEDEALNWLAESKLSPAHLTALGVLSLCYIYLHRNDLKTINQILAQTKPEQFSELPYLYFLRGAMRFASLLPSPEQKAALSGLPMDVRHARPVFGGQELSGALDAALDDFRQALPYATTLGLQHAPRLIESYIVWSELLHPTRGQAALEQLRRDMEDNTRAISRIQYALAYLPGYSPATLETYLQRRDVLGGLNDEELRAAFVIKLHKEDAAGLVSLIAAKRQQAEATFDRSGILSIEIQALAKSGDATSAKIVLEENLNLFDASQLAGLRTEIAKAEGADPVAEHLRLYENDRTPESLRALVSALVRKKDHIGVSKYAELLFSETKDPRDIAVAVEAEMRAGNGDNFVRLFEANPSVKDLDVTFLRYYGWQLFRLGRLREAKQIAEELIKHHPAQRDLHLEIGIAIETGEWELLASPLAAAPSSNLDGLALIRMAQLAQASGQGTLMDLIAAAVAKAGDDPNVLMGAYFLYVEQGLEEERPESHDWFQKALANSGPEGPVQRFEIKELLAQQTEWNRHTSFVSEKLVSGEFPLAVAAPGLRTTLVDLVLRNLIRNSTITDGRRRVAIPLFTGRRLPTAVGSAASVALDITALLLLGWLGLLPAVLEAFPKIILPAGVLAELFEGRSRIRRGQRTRLRKAVEIRDAIAKGQLKVLRAPSLSQDSLAAEIGVELSALLREAKALNGIVIRSAPVPRIGLSGEEADIQPHADHLCDMHGLLKALVDLNAIDEEKEKSAKQYFELQDKGWASSALPDPGRPIFLDGLALVYLQHTKLLAAFLRTFSDVYIHVSTEEEANALIEDDQNVAEVFRVIDEIRSALRQANAADRIVFGPRRADAGTNDYDGIQSSINLFVDLKGAEVVVIDDRALNKELFAVDILGHRARMASTLDLLEELVTRGLLTEDRYRALRYRLRATAAMLVPITPAELLAAAKRNKQNEAPEFRAIRDTLDLARVSEMPQFPSEMRWFMSYVHAIRIAVARAWVDEPDEQRARSLASAIFDMRILPEDWVNLWGQHPPPNWIDAVRCTLIGGFATPVEITDDKKVAAYQKWFDDVLMAEVRSLSPELYARVVDYVRKLALMPWSEEEEDDEQA